MCVRVFMFVCICVYGGSVYCTFLDATKAFDRVDYVKLIKLLVDRMLPPVSVRLLLNMYTSYVCRVS